MHFQSLSTLMELALDDHGDDPEEYASVEPSAMYDEAQLKAELALTLGIICSHSVACRDHLATELGRLPMWAKSIRHRLLSALQVSPSPPLDIINSSCIFVLPSFGVVTPTQKDDSHPKMNPMMKRHFDFLASINEE